MNLHQTSFVQFPYRDSKFTSITVTTYVSNGGKVYTTHGVYSENENNIEEIIDRTKKMAESAMEKTITDLTRRMNNSISRERVDANSPNRPARQEEETGQHQKNRWIRLRGLRVGQKFRV